MLSKLGFNCICCAVDDLEAEVRRLRAAGVETRGEIRHEIFDALYQPGTKAQDFDYEAERFDLAQTLFVLSYSADASDIVAKIYGALKRFLGKFA